MADIRKTVGDLDTWGAFDGTEVMEVFPESEGKSYKKKVGTAADRDVGTGNDDLPDTSQLNVRLGTAGNLGTAAERDVGTGNDDLPDISQLNELINIIESVTGNHTATAPTAIGRTTVIVDATTATITIPDGVPIGGEILVKKIASAQGTITIARSGSDVFTRASLTSVTLNADGDFWLLQKVSATRWDLIDGVEIITSGIYHVLKYSNGTMIQNASVTETVDVITSSASIGGFFGNGASRTWHVTFTQIHGVLVGSVRGAHAQLSSEVLSTTGYTIRYRQEISQSGATVWAEVMATGRWYA